MQVGQVSVPLGIPASLTCSARRMCLGLASRRVGDSPGRESMCVCRTPAQQKGLALRNLVWRAKDPRNPAQQGSVVTAHLFPVGTKAQNHNSCSLSFLPDFMGEVQWELREREKIRLDSGPSLLREICGVLQILDMRAIALTRNSEGRVPLCESG